MLHLLLRFSLPLTTLASLPFALAEPGLRAALPTPLPLDAFGLRPRQIDSNACSSSYQRCPDDSRCCPPGYACTASDGLPACLPVSASDATRTSVVTQSPLDPSSTLGAVVFMTSSTSVMGPSTPAAAQRTAGSGTAGGPSTATSGPAATTLAQAPGSTKPGVVVSTLVVTQRPTDSGGGGGGGGLPQSTQIGLGVGIGVGVPIVAAAVAALVLVLRKRSKRKNNALRIDDSTEPTVGTDNSAEPTVGISREKQPG